MISVGMPSTILLARFPIPITAILMGMVFVNDVAQEVSATRLAEGEKSSLLIEKGQKEWYQSKML